MKDTTILKDELSILKSGKSAVIIELKNATNELNGVKDLILKEEANLEGVKRSVLEYVERLDVARKSLTIMEKNLVGIMSELGSHRNTLETLKIKSKQEKTEHLGRIKSLQKEEEAIKEHISKLKDVYDSNLYTYNSNIKALTEKEKRISIEVKAKEEKLEYLNQSLDKTIEEDKRLTKERLKREDKLRMREKLNEAKEFSLSKKEEDIVAMTRDVTIIYNRLKELYAVVDPSVDLDRLITQPI